MRFKDTIKGAKKILKIAKRNPEFYNEDELRYVRMLKKQAKINLKRKQSVTDKTDSVTP
ncbi:hypothetical protein CPRG_00091 [Synechococcus phage Syn30]|uniref:Uncharacterized protein n=1 Tax=Synechococcus phage Syn30 TaxID=536474 RepID=M4SLP3_9CAUD|nr:hypothetical protein CPRG_00091 [Synechococcus phage Syn30]AGH56175.1 hypothetical protein CPRG_00091 [Synechococcus phage Syn30]